MLTVSVGQYILSSLAGGLFRNICLARLKQFFAFVWKLQFIKFMLTLTDNWMSGYDQDFKVPLQIYADG